MCSELPIDKALQIVVDKIINRIKLELIAEKIDCSVCLEIFGDAEVKNWDSIGITIKLKGNIKSHKALQILWDKLTVLMTKEINRLETGGEITKSERDYIQSKLVISLDID